MATLATSSGVFGLSPHAAPDVLRLGHRSADVTERLGPGRRAVLYVGGCPLRCAGCIVADTLVPADTGRLTPVADVVRWLLGLRHHDGLTVSGGEPLWQPEACTAIIDAVRAARPEWDVMLYTGWRLEATLRRGLPAHRALLARVDLLIDGPYVERWHEPARLWRGSAQQRLIALSPQGRRMIARRADVGAGYDVHITADAVQLVGIPQRRGEHLVIRAWLSGEASHDEPPPRGL
jgi:anaerobic ribonucleoside-triphosphate reductase activating protein